MNFMIGTYGSRRLSLTAALGFLVVCFGISFYASAADWAGWRGPHGDFTTDTKDLADSWPEDGPRRIWSRALGAGYSAVSAVDDRLYTMYRDGDSDVVICLNAEDGKTIWEHQYAAPTLQGQSVEFGKGPNSTPLVLKDRLVSIRYTGKLHSLDRGTGKVLWKHNLVADFDGKVQEFGYSASPTLYKGNIIVLVGGEKHGVIAFHPADGKIAWAGKPEDISYATPVYINVDGQDQMVVMASTEIIGMNPANGDVFWRHPCLNQYKNHAADPIWSKANSLLWVATELDGGARVLRLKQKDGKTEVEQVWFNDDVKIFHWNAVLVGDHVYGSIGSEVTFLAAVDLATGKIRWKERGFHKALCVYADDKLIFLDENGQLALAKVSPDALEIRSKVQLTDKVSWTVPTLVGKTLYVRDQKNLMALDLGRP